MKEAGHIVAVVLAELSQKVRPGITTAYLDQLAADIIRKHHATPTFKGYNGFPANITTCINEELVHGIPNRKRFLKEGDIVSIDCGATYKGWIGDAATTVPVGQISPEAQRLLDVTQKALYRGIRAARAGNHLYDIGAAIEDYANSQHVSVVKEWGGHGIGKQLHEPPSVSHTRMPVRGPKLKPGMIFTIEPMINLGRKDWRLLTDGWTVVTMDRSLSAQFEHTIVITRNGPEILTKI